MRVSDPDYPRLGELDAGEMLAASVDPDRHFVLAFSLAGMWNKTITNSVR